MNTTEKDFIIVYKSFDNSKQIEIIALIDNLLQHTEKEVINDYNKLIEEIGLNIKFDKISHLKQLINNLEWDNSYASKFQSGC
jgi:hypothetical protein